MQWLNAVPAIVIAFTVLMGPGIVLAWALRARGFALCAFAPLFSVSLVVVAALACPLLNVPWSVVPVLVLTVVASATAFAVSRRGRASWTPPRGAGSRFVFALLGTVLAAVLIGARLIYVFGSPESISQTYDNIFHLNAVQYILHTQQASSLTVGGMTGIPFYPSGWHAVVSLTAQLSGASIPVAVNATNLVIGAVVWPLSCILLCQQVLGQSRVAAVLAGVISTGFGAFPLMMVDFGVLYPNLLSISLLPALLALGVQVLRLSAVQDFPPLARALALLIALPGISFAHPSTVMAFFAFLTPAVVLVFVKSCRGWRATWQVARKRAVLWSVALGAGFGVLVLAWQTVRPLAEAAFWPPIQSPLGALFELATNSEMNRPPAIVVSICMAVGLLAMLRRRDLWWALGMFGMACALFLVVSSFRPGRLRDFVTAIWYNDSYRLAALVPTAAVLVATFGAHWIVRRVQRYVADRKARAARPGGAGQTPRWLGAVTIGAVLLLSQVGGVQYATDKARVSYELRDDSPLITTDEMAVLQDMQRLVPEDAVVAANAWNGSALAYALSDRRTIQLHVLSSSFTLNDKIVLDSLREAGTNPEVCGAVRALNVTYVLDFGGQEINNGSHPAPGLADLEHSGVATLLSRHGDAKLFSFDGC
ncbi:hypothetical protein QFZ65_001478 [Arthrobacter sp. B3I9]|uniref:DUF6541 family protein n=1 Tax=Arthrobacter sp. B3I9 TaxID=3042270 RepID=UPI002793F223|nr:DUF6541 family protein [Arthrobacter sp. B3I9]MDQ0849540.1 hypothetical protein [Arthrobacter sp. B3I9]